MNHTACTATAEHDADRLYAHVADDLAAIIFMGADRVDRLALEPPAAVGLMLADVARAMPIVAAIAATPAEKRRLVVLWAQRYFDRVSATGGLPACLQPTRRRIFLDQVGVIYDTLLDVFTASDAPGIVASFQPRFH